jgi:hypothetical protein
MNLLVFIFMTTIDGWACDMNNDSERYHDDKRRQTIMQKRLDHQSREIQDESQRDNSHVDKLSFYNHPLTNIDFIVCFPHLTELDVARCSTV